MAIKKDDFIEMEYTGRLKDNNELFDTTDEQAAKDADVYNSNAKYGSVIICVGEGQIVEGLDEAIIGKEPGKYTIDLTPEQAFGRKDAKLIQMVPLTKFTQNEIKPFPGLQVNIDDAIGTVKTVSGGRVLVDFNHPLSGKDLIYEVEIKRQVTDKKEQVESLLNLLIGMKDIHVTMDGNKAKVELPANMPPQIAEELTKKIIALVKVDGLEFVDTRKAEKKAEVQKEKSTETPEKTNELAEDKKEIPED
jgi:FKBP-type peptidyl-prolyl cis-trans isomerase 2